MIGAEVTKQLIVNSPKTYLFGIGNSGRSDDGLGWALLDVLKEEGSFRGQLIYRYQLQIEDANLIQEADQVIFVDANHDKLEAGFLWKNCYPVETFHFTTHALPPETILFLSRELYQKSPPAYGLYIQGETWGLNIGLSEHAKFNMQNAKRFFKQLLITSQSVQI